MILVKELFHVGYPGAVEKIIEDFNSFIKNNEFLNIFKAIIFSFWSVLHI